MKARTLVWWLVDNSQVEIERDERGLEVTTFHGLIVVHCIVSDWYFFFMDQSYPSSYPVLLGTERILYPGGHKVMGVVEPSSLTHVSTSEHRSKLLL